MQPAASALEKEIDMAEDLRVLGVGQFDLALAEKAPGPEDGVHQVFGEVSPGKAKQGPGVMVSLTLFRQDGLSGAAGDVGGPDVAGAIPQGDAVQPVLGPDGIFKKWSQLIHGVSLSWADTEKPQRLAVQTDGVSLVFG
jgi:hypothetical protein